MKFAIYLRGEFITKKVGVVLAQRHQVNRKGVIIIFN